MEIYFQSASLFVLHGDSRARAGAKRMRVARSVRPQPPKKQPPSNPPKPIIPNILPPPAPTCKIPPIMLHLIPN